MVDVVLLWFAALPDTSQAAIIASLVTLGGAIVAAIAGFVGAYVTHRGNEGRLKKQLAYDRQQRRIERRAEVVAELYSKLVELRRAASDFVRWYSSVDEGSKKRYLEQLWRAADAFDGHFGRNRIYIDRAICNSIDTFGDALSKATSMLAGFVRDAGTIELPDEQVFKEWEKALDILERDVPAISSALETSFRALLDMKAE